METSRGGENCKYDHNEDSAVAAIDKSGKVEFAASIDAAGGSQRGVEAARIISRLVPTEIANSDLSKVSPAQILEKAFENADNKVNANLRNAQGVAEGYACAAFSVVKRETKEVAVGVKGDSRGLIFVERVVDGKRKVHLTDRTLLGNVAGEKHSGGGRAVDKEYLQSSRVDKSTIATSIGTDVDEPEEDPDIIEFKAQDGDIVTVVLASDGGIGDRVSDYEILQTYVEVKGNPRILQKRSMRIAKSRNGTRDIDVRYGPGEKEVVNIKNDSSTVGKGDSDNITFVVTQTKF